ncbi:MULTISPECIES: hypothetical protein, partial [unclassified Ectothiorhodospira]|uniref:hypothetical protein n=1 Tax=unclassified Ectothiorhodospira TaxID=2684909 RepID=UPI001EE7BCC8
DIEGGGSMSDPLSLNVIESEFSENSEAWVLQDRQPEKYLTIPHPRYPGRHPIHFFLKKEDAQDVLQEIVEVNPDLADKEIYPVNVKLLQACRGIAANQDPGNADGFVVHPPNEVYEFLQGKNR